MHKLIKYLKPFWFLILTAMVLLFAQAQCELALPDYMSSIVTNGIQYGGIESAVYEAMSTDTMEHLLILASQEDRQLIEDSYTLVEKGNAELSDTILALKDQDVYVLNDQKKKDPELEEALLKPVIYASILSSNEIAEMFGSTQTELYAAIAADTKMKDALLGALDEKLLEQGVVDSALNSAAILAVKSEYQQLKIDTDAIQSRYIYQAGIKMLQIALIGMLCSIAVGFLSARIGAGLSRNLRSLVFNKVESFSSEEFNHFSTASLITRTTNDVQRVQQIMVMSLRIIIYAPILGIGAMGKVIRTNANMLWIVALVLVVILSVLFTTFAVAMPKFKLIQKLLDRLNLIAREALSGMLVIRAFNTEKIEEQRFDKANRDMTKINLFVNRTMASVMPIMEFIMSSVSILIIWVGSHYIDMGTLQVGDMMAFMQYSMQILMAFVMIAMILIMLPQASVSAERISEVIDAEVRIKDPETVREFDAQKRGEVVFDHVYFQYPNAEAYVLEDITFTAEAGKTTAFIGSTGSGKSTLINLIPRFFDVTKGSLRVDGIDVKEVSQHDLRKKIGYVPQKGVLFSGDIESNLRYGKETASPEAIQTAIEVSQSKEFIDSKPEGLKSLIAQGGSNVSGGQKQRLSIARALAKQAEIYIFDDSFSALDFKTDALLREALNKLIAKEKSTVFIVAQRISTIMNADQIVVLDQGKIAGIGTHEKLMQDCEVYRQIAYSQLSKEELEHE